VTIQFDAAARAVYDEAEGAQARFGDFASMHEAYGVLQEEVDEFFAAVKLQQGHPDRAHRCRAEAIQVAAVALRIVEQAFRVTR
jgi:hypothetical protein